MNVNIQIFYQMLQTPIVAQPIFFYSCLICLHVYTYLWFVVVIKICLFMYFFPICLIIHIFIHLLIIYDSLIYIFTIIYFVVFSNF